MNEDLLPEDAAIDDFLAASRRKLDRRLTPMLDLDAGLTAVLNSGADAHRHEPPAVRGPGVLPSRSAQAPQGRRAAAILTMRVLARDLARDLIYIRALADAFLHACALADALRHAHDIPHDGDSVLTDAVERARHLRRALARDLVRDFKRAHSLVRTGASSAFALLLVDAVVDAAGTRDSGRVLNLDRYGDIALDLDRAGDLERALAVARALTRSLDRGMALPDALQSALNQVEELANELVSRFRAGVVDASRADLSGLDVTDVSILEGVVWTKETIWAPDVRRQVETLSREIRSGIYQVGRGSDQPPPEHGRPGPASGQHPERQPPSRPSLFSAQEVGLADHQR